MAFEWDPQHRAFLDGHMWGVLATGRKDGSPQQSMIGYGVDDHGRLLMSVKSYTAKWNNAVRQPRVSVTVPDGRTHLVVYGLVECIDEDPLRLDITAQVFGVLRGEDVPDEDKQDMIPFLDEQQRTVLRLTPHKTFFQE